MVASKRRGESKWIEPMRNPVEGVSLILLCKFALSKIGNYAGQLQPRVIIEETERFIYTGESSIVSGLRRP